MILFPVVFIICIPNMLNAGNNMGIIQNAFSDVFKSRLGSDNIGSLFVLHPMTPNTINAILNEIKSEIVDNGVS